MVPGIRKNDFYDFFRIFYEEKSGIRESRVRRDSAISSGWGTAGVGAQHPKLSLEPDDEGSELAHDAIWTIYGFLISEQTSRRFDLVFSTAENHIKKRSRKHFSYFSQDTHELFPDFSLIFSGLFPDFSSRFFFCFSKIDILRDAGCGVPGAGCRNTRCRVPGAGCPATTW